MTGDDTVERLYATTDASVWAEEFMAVVDGKATVDFGLMVGWFANAIETAKAHARAARSPIEDEVVVLPRTALFEFFGQVALPPWKDERGHTIGERVDCAPIAQQISEWVDAHDVTAVVLDPERHVRVIHGRTGDGDVSAAKLPLFDADRRCPKCGHDEVSTHYQKNAHCSYYPDRCVMDRVSEPACCDSKESEHLHRICQRCHHWWAESVVVSR